MYNAATYERQVDRACAAQSTDLLPTKPPTPQEIKARNMAMKASIDKHFEV